MFDSLRTLRLCLPALGEQAGERCIEFCKEVSMNVKRRDFLKSVLSATALGMSGCNMVNARNSVDKPNVLFISVDDLRPQLNCYGFAQIKSPNIDRLAAEGMLFERAYCQVAVCLPSRVSLMSGMRPDTTKVMNLHRSFRKHNPKAVLLHQYFKSFGYRTVGMGKILHAEEPASWDEWVDIRKNHDIMQYVSKEIRQGMAERAAEVRKKGLKGKEAKQHAKGPAAECADVPDNKLHDGCMTDVAIEKMRELKDEPFFLAVGFRKPHLPFISPKKYWDMYDRDDIKLADNPFPPRNSPQVAHMNWGELRGYNGMPKQGNVLDAQAKELIHGYYACVSFVDAQIGRLLDELEKLELKENTMIILWGDHGWKLGEHGMWAKHTNYENDTWAPMIYSFPEKFKHGRTRALVEFVDIYPSLCEMSGLPVPEYCEGLSFKPLLSKPDRSWKKAAFSQYPRQDYKYIGYAAKTDRYRYVEWKDMSADGKIYARELYDHQVDPKENINLAGKKEYETIVQDHSQLISGRWQSALP
jgi:arylsulfatase A-like enzyme